MKRFQNVRNRLRRFALPVTLATGIALGTFAPKIGSMLHERQVVRIGEVRQIEIPRKEVEQIIKAELGELEKKHVNDLIDLIKKMPPLSENYLRIYRNDDKSVLKLLDGTPTTQQELRQLHRLAITHYLQGVKEVAFRVVMHSDGSKGKINQTTQQDQNTQQALIQQARLDLAGTATHHAFSAIYRALPPKQQEKISLEHEVGNAMALLGRGMHDNRFPVVHFFPDVSGIGEPLGILFSPSEHPSVIAAQHALNGYTGFLKAVYANQVKKADHTYK